MFDCTSQREKPPMEATDDESLSKEWSHFSSSGGRKPFSVIKNIEELSRRFDAVDECLAGIRKREEDRSVEKRLEKLEGNSKNQAEVVSLDDLNMLKLQCAEKLPSISYLEAQAREQSTRLGDVSLALSMLENKLAELDVSKLQVGSLHEELAALQGGIAQLVESKLCLAVGPLQDELAALQKRAWPDSDLRQAETEGLRHLSGLEAQIAKVEAQLQQSSVGAMVREDAIEERATDRPLARNEQSASVDDNCGDVDGIIEAEICTLKPSFHLAVVYFTLKPDYPAWRRVAWLCCAFVVLSMQIVCLMAVWLGTVSPSCLTSAICQEGFFCNRQTIVSDDMKWVALPKRCMSCSYAARVSGTGNATAYCEDDLGNDMCDSCYNKLVYSDSWDPTDWDQVVLDNIRLMHVSDWLAYVLAIAVVSMDTVHEACDIMAAHLTRRSRSEHVLATLALSVLAVMRQCIVLGLLAYGVIGLVLKNGSLALHILLNTLGLLFILQIDDAIFNNFLSEEIVADMGRSPLLRVDKHIAEKFMSRTKVVYSVLFPLTMLTPVVHYYLTLGATNWFLFNLAVPSLTLAQARIDFRRPSACVINLCKDWILPCLLGFVAINALFFFIGFFM